jgi:hypothetical protein
MIRISITFDPSNTAMPLKLEAPRVNPALLCCLMSQCITALTSNDIERDTSSLIVHPGVLPKIPKIGRG